ncbi:RNA polymerase sigma factor [Adhaeribacter aquaticus]|uniref:RNA polymerase sigma factor n=1 Tax=Adhaeribacter aquaticus TaxID=299567 RepID=UPI000410BEA1|nr:RNA polymerase sigma factor [Adhaeribacter aquaticus]
MEAISDSALMLKVKDGDTDRLGLLFERYHRALYSFFYRLTSKGEVSEDLVQNVFLRMLKYRHTYTGAGEFKTWMYHLARNVHADYYQKNKRLGFSDDFTHLENKLQDDFTVEEQTRQEEEMHLLQLALNQLELEKREILILSRYQGLKYKEIAELYGCSEGAIKVRAFRALDELKNIYLKLERQEIV